MWVQPDSGRSPGGGVLAGETLWTEEPGAATVHRATKSQHD